MRKLLWSGLLALVLTLSTTLPARAGAPAPRRLAERAEVGGRVRVIVELDEFTIPEGWLPDRGLRLAQRARVAGVQARLREALAGSDASRIRPYDSVPFMALEVGADALARLERHAAVRAIREDRPARPLLDNSVPFIQSDLAQDIGFDGAGQVVVVLDTGVDGGHQNLAGKIVDEACFASGYSFNPNNGDCPNGGETQTGSGSAVACDYDDECGHGTHVAGIAVGSGPSYSGVAPGADLIPIQVFSEFPGSQCSDGNPCPQSWSSDQDLALLYVFNTLSGSHDIAAVNMSLGGDAYSDQAACDADRPSTKAAIDQLRSIGIATVIAAGNGSCGTGCLDALSTPACISSAVSVGAVRIPDGFPWAYTNRASFMSFWAGGLGITAPLYETTNQYVSYNGTSMAAPHVAGAFAIAAEAVPGVSVDTALAAFQSTGAKVVNGLGVKRILLRDALVELGFPECDDGYDNDGDALVDLDDPGCESAADPWETREELPCDNGLDDDDDGDIDTADPGCRDPQWTREDPECQDGIDNDSDGGTDYDGSPADDRCSEPYIVSESASKCGLGAELALAAAGLLALRRRARSR
ncbi:MAG: S8 family serine peptidase [Myxococcota bacterium]